MGKRRSRKRDATSQPSQPSESQADLAFLPLDSLKLVLSHLSLGPCLKLRLTCRALKDALSPHITHLALPIPYPRSTPCTPKTLEHAETVRLSTTHLATPNSSLLLLPHYQHTTHITITHSGDPWPYHPPPYGGGRQQQRQPPPIPIITEAAKLFSPLPPMPHISTLVLRGMLLQRGDPALIAGRFPRLHTLDLIGCHLCDHNMPVLLAIPTLRCLRAPADRTPVQACSRLTGLHMEASCFAGDRGKINRETLQQVARLTQLEELTVHDIGYINQQRYEIEGIDEYSDEEYEYGDEDGMDGDEDEAEDEEGGGRRRRRPLPSYPAGVLGLAHLAALSRLRVLRVLGHVRDADLTDDEDKVVAEISADAGTLRTMLGNKPGLRELQLGHFWNANAEELDTVVDSAPHLTCLDLLQYGRSFCGYHPLAGTAFGCLSRLTALQRLSLNGCTEYAQTEKEQFEGDQSSGDEMYRDDFDEYSCYTYREPKRKRWADGHRPSRPLKLREDAMQPYTLHGHLDKGPGWLLDLTQELTQLTHLDLSRWVRVTPKAIAVLGRLPSLTSLSLAHIPGLEAEVLDAVHQIRTLKTLDLSGCYIHKDADGQHQQMRSEAAGTLLQLCAALPDLHRLLLRGCLLDEAMLGMLWEAAPYLGEVDVGDAELCILCKAQLKQLAKHLTLLTSPPIKVRVWVENPPKPPHPLVVSLGKKIHSKAYAHLAHLAAPQPLRKQVLEPFSME